MVDRFEDVTPPEKVQMNNKCDRNVTLYGYLRGCNLKKGAKVCETCFMYNSFLRIVVIFYVKIEWFFMLEVFFRVANSLAFFCDGLEGILGLSMLFEMGFCVN